VDPKSETAATTGKLISAPAEEVRVKYIPLDGSLLIEGHRLRLASKRVVRGPIFLGLGCGTEMCRHLKTPVCATHSGSLVIS
jgi:hypothetical protein